MIKKIHDLSKGYRLLYLSLASRFTVLLILLLISLLSGFLNNKIGFNNARLVGLSSGPIAQFFYTITDFIFSFSDDTLELLQTNGGMTWYLRLFGIPFTDPIAAISLLLKSHSLPIGFGIGLILPLLVATLAGRLFCSYICPASLYFFSMARIRRILERYLLLPHLQLQRTVAWGVLAGGLIATWIFGHGIWALLLPYLAMGQTIFGAIAAGTISSMLISLLIYGGIDIVAGPNFSCRYLCPTGRLLGTIGSYAPITIRRDSSRCLERCTICNDVCPMGIEPRSDQTRDCSLCGECLILCPTGCLDIGYRKHRQLPDHKSANQQKGVSP